MASKAILLILDGWGITGDPKVSAVAQANTPFIDSLFQKYPNSTLEASGLAVGLPVGQMGNSEVGHMNLGAGRVVYQDLVKISQALSTGELSNNLVLKQTFDYVKENHKKLHLIGLVSDGGVHSHIDHVKGLLSLAKENGVSETYLHAFTDGRDTDPNGGFTYLKDVQSHLSQTGGKLASVIGRYFAMDRDRRWERVKLAYDLLVNGQGLKTQNVLQAIEDSYNQGVTDEFIQPIVQVDDKGNPLATIQEGDAVLCFNFRTDRGRQITEVLTQQACPDYNMQPLHLHYVTLTNYDNTFKNVAVLFEKDNLANTLGEVLEGAGKSQIRIAETEKYPHVTFFFSGGREKEFTGESRILCPSPKVATYDLQPQMSAFEIRDKIVPKLKAGAADFVCLNFANPDMVGHTGVFEAAVKACETVDACTKDVVEAALEGGYYAIVIADHGNAEFMKNADGSPNTAHTTNLVPFVLASNETGWKLEAGKLGDMAPTILSLMKVAIPGVMSGKVLVSHD